MYVCMYVCIYWSNTHAHIYVDQSWSKNIPNINTCTDQLSFLLKSRLMSATYILLTHLFWLKFEKLVSC